MPQWLFAKNAERVFKYENFDKEVWPFLRAAGVLKPHQARGMMALPFRSSLFLARHLSLQHHFAILIACKTPLPCHRSTTQARQAPTY